MKPRAAANITISVEQEGVVHLVALHLDEATDAAAGVSERERWRGNWRSGKSHGCAGNEIMQNRVADLLTPRQMPAVLRCEIEVIDGLRHET